MSRKDPQINLRLPQELKDKVHEIASENRRSVNAELVKMIESCVAEYSFFKESEGEGRYSVEEVPTTTFINSHVGTGKTSVVLNLLKEAIIRLEENED